MRWIDDQGRDDIPADHVGMIGYLGEVPTADVSEPGYGDPDGQAFMVEMGGDTEPLRTHFHVVDQFQLFVHGTGAVGRHAVAPGTVHYADRLTPYGPLVAGPSGLSYVTLRGVSDTGAYFMPDQRDALRDGLDASTHSPGARRNLTFELGDLPASGAAPSEQPGDPIQVIHADDDGLQITVIDPGPDTTTVLPPFDGAGAFAVVIGGEIVDPVPHRPGSVTYGNAGDRLAITTGTAHTRVAVLQLPLTSDRSSEPRATSRIQC